MVGTRFLGLKCLIFVKQQGVLKRADNILSWDFDLNIEEIVDMWKKVVVYNVVCCAGRKM